MSLALVFCEFMIVMVLEKPVFFCCNLYRIYCFSTEQSPQLQLIRALEAKLYGSHKTL